MRLTLRTMLAYLDDVLEPSDALELGKKIEESKFASDLVHRIRNSMRQIRLDAPKLDGRGMGLDANTVADYLDNTLPPERVPDFEKVCLDSDRHLAEVAACHQVLAIVLGEPAQVDPSLRDRIYRIGAMSAQEIERTSEAAAAVSEAASVAKTSASRGASATSGHPPVPPPKSVEVVAKYAGTSEAEKNADKASRPTPEIPDYLREPSKSSNFWPLVLTLLVAFIGGLAALLLLGPLDHTHPVLGMWLKAPQVAESGSEETREPSASGNALTPPAEIDGKPNDASPKTEESGKAPVNQPLDRNVDGDAKSPVTPMPAIEPIPTQPIGNSPVPAPGATLIPEPKPGEGRPPMPPTDPAGDPMKPAVPGEANPPASPAKPVAPGVERGGDVGRYLSEQQVLAHFDPQRKTWRRMSRGATILADERYAVPVTYRPIISLTSGIQVMVIGDSSFRFRTTEGSEVIGMSLDYGRTLLSNTGRAGGQLAVNFAGEQGMLAFGDRDAELAVEVRHYLFPGADPERDPSLLILHFFSTSGRVEFQPVQGPAVSLTAGQGRIMVLGGEAPHVSKLDSPPMWLDANQLPKIDRDASAELEKMLSVDKALPLALAEQTDHRKTEVRSLAARCLGSLDEFDAMIEELGTDKQHSYWTLTVDSLRDAIARSPSSASTLKTTLERKRPGEAAVIFRIIQDYSPEQLERGGAKQIVGFLEHGDLAVRVLAYETLRRITGFTQNFRPEVSADRRKLPVQKWNEKLKDGLIIYRVAPSPLPDRRPGGAAATEAAPGTPLSP